MDMLALPVLIRCLLDTLPFVTRDKKGTSFGYESSHSYGEGYHGRFLLGGMYIEGCSEDFM